MSDSNCCSFTAKFCTTNGSVVIAKMTLKKGIFSVSYYNLDGTPHVENDIDLNTCQNLAVTNTSPFTLSLVVQRCVSNKEPLTVNLNFGGIADIVGLKNGSKINLRLTHDLSYESDDFYGLSPVGAFSLLKESGGKFTIVITNVSLLSSSLSFVVPFANEGCVIPNNYYGDIENVLSMKSGYGASPLIGDSTSN